MEGALTAFSATTKRRVRQLHIPLQTPTIFPEGSDLLARALQSFSGLTSLDISWNNIGDHEVAALGAAMPRMSALGKLMLSGNCIADIDPVANALEANKLPLKMLALQKNYIVDLRSLGAALCANESLEIMFLAYNKIRDVTPIGDALWTNKTLWKLGISGNNIEDVTSLQSIAGNATLRNLALAHNAIVDVSALGDALRFNTAMDRLDFAMNGIVDVTTFGEALKTNTTLTWLCLSFNKIRDVSKLGEALKVNRTLVHLDLKPVRNREKKEKRPRWRGGGGGGGVCCWSLSLTLLTLFFVCICSGAIGALKKAPSRNRCRKTNTARSTGFYLLSNMEGAHIDRKLTSR
jgi:hypothetical protein